jgi:hypothetical protein
MRDVQLMAIATSNAPTDAVAADIKWIGDQWASA